jgi:dephospho-CoA kinase
LVGGIGSGKSSVAVILSGLGAKVIDSDQIARQELSNPDVIRVLRTWWGENICRPDGSIDRSQVADRVFADAREQRRLTELIHPRVAERRRVMMEAFQGDPHVRAIVIDSPLLIEAGLGPMCDRIIFVHADRALRLNRLGRDRGWSEAELQRREKSQNPLDTKRALADYIVDNNSDIDELRSQVEPLFLRVLQETSESSGRSSQETHRGEKKDTTKNRRGATPRRRRPRRRMIDGSGG